MKYITLKAVLRQLSKDLIGKDAYRGVSLTYALLANQLGHFSLGFIPAILLYLVLADERNSYTNTMSFSFMVAGFWLLFEIVNLASSKYKLSPKSKTIITKKKFPFKPSWGNLIFDTFTDLCFFWAGAFFAASWFIEPPYRIIIYLAILFLLSILFFYWYITKMFLQEALYPFHQRLSQWDIDIAKENKNAVRQFIDNETGRNHLLVFGDNIVQKSALCIGIATELSYSFKTCTYLTAMKLCGMFTSQRQDNLSVTSKSLWTWREASLLIIDYISPSRCLNEELVTTKQFNEYLDNDVYGTTNKNILREKKTIWVLGDYGPDATKQQSWENLLEKIGIEKSNIKTINLSFNGKDKVMSDE